MDEMTLAEIQEADACMKEFMLYEEEKSYDVYLSDYEAK